ncbi:V-type proton ATPase subunit F [Strongyloides ratti]|uniref:V-type proton ATPase subunit F n=1 Tax=Strongyloides ratti TaxID=34506 RepID=A0A090KYY4_STRRB|nr:V-type proton ATPase subunit F [Strongyloides ratti]CEF62646.1 V-type proton ATPase subunit F [Strongyloides ratti]
MKYSDKNGLIVAVIGDEDTVVGFLLGGIGGQNDNKVENFFIVKKDTAPCEIEKAFNSFVERNDIGIIFINQNIAIQIKEVIDNHKKIIPAVLEIPSKEAPYDLSKDSFVNRASKFFPIEEFM